MKFPVQSLLAGNFGLSETGSLETASSSGESRANLNSRSRAPKIPRGQGSASNASAPGPVLLPDPAPLTHLRSSGDCLLQRRVSKLSVPPGARKRRCCLLSWWGPGSVLKRITGSCRWFRRWSRRRPDRGGGKEVGRRKRRQNGGLTTASAGTNLAGARVG